MSKTDTVARFSLIFAQKVQFSENSSVRENFCQKLAEASSAKPLIVEDHGMGGALASAKFAHGVHAHGVQLCSGPQCSVTALPSSTTSALELARRGHVVQRLHVVKALHCRRRAGPGRQHRLAVRVAALLTRPGLQAVELAAKAVAMLGALP